MEYPDIDDWRATSTAQLVDFVVTRFAEDGVHVLTLGHGAPLHLGFGRYRGESEVNPLELRSFVGSAHRRILGREGYMSLLTLTTVRGAVPEPGVRVLRFADLRGPRRRFGWLLSADGCTGLSRSSLGRMVPQERGVKLRDAASPQAKARM